MKIRSICICRLHQLWHTLYKALEDQGIDLKKANLQRIPTTPVEFTEEQMEEIEKMLDRIEDDDDVQAVYTNIA